MSGFHVVVFSCGELGVRVANEAVKLSEISAVTLIESPYRQKHRSVADTILRTYRMEGIPGFIEVAKRRLGMNGQDRRGPVEPEELASGVERIKVNDFHAPDGIKALLDLAPDLGVLAGTYILQEAVFSVPRIGSINLHAGKVPEYRGSAPAFWELYNGESEVGITIHQVESKLDAGAIYTQETFPLDPAPETDPISYIEQYREGTLMPNGVRMITSTVAALARGEAVGTPQDHSRAHTYRMPDYRATKELRRRIARRRAQLRAAKTI